MDAFRVALANKEDDRRGVGRRVVGQALLPVSRDLARLGGDGVDVGGERERDDISLQTVDHGARLRPRPVVRLLERDRLARVLFPLLCEGRVDRLVEFACRIVGNIEERLVRVRLRAGQRQRQEKSGPPKQAQPHGCETALRNRRNHIQYSFYGLCGLYLATTPDGVNPQPAARSPRGRP